MRHTLKRSLGARSAATRVSHTLDVSGHFRPGELGLAACSPRILCTEPILDRWRRVSIQVLSLYFKNGQHSDGQSGSGLGGNSCQQSDWWLMHRWRSDWSLSVLLTCQDSNKVGLIDNLYNGRPPFILIQIDNLACSFNNPGQFL